MKYFYVVSFILIIGFSNSGFAQNKVVVIPLWGAADTNHRINNVVTAAKKNGDFTSVIAAMNSIVDATPSNPYLLAIGPGEYVLDETLILKANVSITGAGEELTKLVMNVKDEPVLETSLNGYGTEKVQHITIENTSGGATCIAIGGGGGFNTGVFEYVTANAYGCSFRNTAFNAMDGATFSHVTAYASGGVYTAGISFGSFGPGMLDNVSVSAYGGSNTTTALSTFQNLTITNSRIRSSGSNFTYGVYLLNDISLNRPFLITNTEIVATNLTSGDPSVAVFNHNRGNLEHRFLVRRSTLSGETNSILSSANTSTVISQSTLIGGTSGDGYLGSKSCVATDNGNGLLLPADCVELISPSD